jgi:CubicO group peptidase (beta-lactamase class C family)
MRRQNYRGIFLAIIGVIMLSVGNGYAQQAPPEDIDEYVSRAMKEFNVPGIAVAIVKDGKIQFAKGYGVKKMGETAPVDADTLFAIASNTKAFTAAALGILVDEKKISWDDPVIKYLPNFQMYDPYVSREITIRDLITHRSGLGLGCGDLLVFPSSDFSRDDIVYKQRFMKPATSFRSHYAYDNLLFIVAGQIIPAVTGKSWEEFVKERIFDPLGMNSTNSSITALKPGVNFASPHAKAEGQLQTVPYMNFDNGVAAGGINSSVNDMSKWMIAQLDAGLIHDPERGDHRLFSERVSKDMWTAQTPITIGDSPPQLAALRPNFINYGLGWLLSDYRGRKMVWHTGGLPGMYSRVTLMPELKLGIVVLTNQEDSAAFHSISWHILDHYLNAPANDWVSAYKEVRARNVARVEEEVKRQMEARNKDSKPSLPLEKYVGNYRDNWYGIVTIEPAANRLVIKFTHTPDLVGDLEHFQYDTFIAHWRNRSLNADAYVTFSLHPDGSIAEMKMKPVSPNTDFSFDFQDLLFTPADAAMEKK